MADAAETAGAGAGTDAGAVVAPKSLSICAVMGDVGGLCALAAAVAMRRRRGGRRRPRLRGETGTRRGDGHPHAQIHIRNSPTRHQFSVPQFPLHVHASAALLSPL